MKPTFFVVLLLFSLECATASSEDAAAAAAEAAAGPTAGATPGAAVCSLKIQGFGNRAGLKSVSLSCMGGTITARAHKLLQDIWGPKKSPGKGVTMSDSAEGCQINDYCFLTVCGGSNAVFQSPSITAIKATDAMLSDLVSLLCIAGGSKMTVHKGTFSSNELISLAIYDSNTSVLIESSVIQDNDIKLTGDNSYPGGIYVENATLHLQSCTVSGNTAYGDDAGAIAAKDEAKVSIVDSQFLRNKANYGGAVQAFKQARVSIQGSHFEANEAQKNGGALYFQDAQVDVIPSRSGRGQGRTTFKNNTALGGGGDIAAELQSVVIISRAILTGSTGIDGGGSLYVPENSNMTVLGSVIMGAHSETHSGGCIDIRGNGTAKLVSTVVSGCKTPRAGGGISVLDQGTLELVNSEIKDNTGGLRGTLDEKTNVHGGGVGAFDTASVVLEGCEFIGNYAHYGGGGLSLFDSATLSTRGPQPSYFHNNTAGTTGGGLRLGSGTAGPSAEVLQLIRAEGNVAPNAPEVSIEATNITIINSSNANNFIASDSRDGFLQLTLNVSGAHGLPSDDELMYSLFDSNNSTLFDQAIKSSGTELREVAISLKQPPGRYYLVFTTASSDQGLVARLPVNVVPCPQGHVTGGRDDTCNKCPLGLYSLSTQDAQCSVCGANTECPGGAVVWPAKGFWHSSPQSTQMHRCFNPSACIGGAAAAAARPNRTSSKRAATRGLLNATSAGQVVDYKTAQCSEPYQENLCGDCKPGYGKVRPFLCRKCMSTGAILVLYILAIVVVVGIVKLLVHFSISAATADRLDPTTPTPSEMLRALVLHSQWLYIICGSVGVPWPSSVAYPMHIIGGIWSSTSGSSIGFECLLPTGGLPVPIQKVLICLLTPVGILCLVLAIEGLIQRLHLVRSGRGAAGQDFASLMICIVFMFLPTWVSTVLSLFTCVPLDSPVEAPYKAEAVGNFWVEHMAQMCYKGYHRGWALGLGIPLTLFFCLALPLGVFLLMWYSRKHNRLSNRQFQKHYGFMFKLWKERVCWWESVVLLQTVALVMVATFGFTMGPYYQCLVSATVLAGIGLLLLVVRPFKCAAANNVAVMSICVLFFTAQTALSFLTYNNISPGPVYGNIMGVVIMLANIAFLGGTTWRLLKVVDWAAIKTAIAYMHGCCKKGQPTDMHSSAGTCLAGKSVAESMPAPSGLPK